MGSSWRLWLTDMEQVGTHLKHGGVLSSTSWALVSYTRHYAASQYLHKMKQETFRILRRGRREAPIHGNQEAPISFHFLEAPISFHFLFLFCSSPPLSVAGTFFALEMAHPPPLWQFCGSNERKTNNQREKLSTFNKGIFLYFYTGLHMITSFCF
jgi:hypothetical protein